MKDSIAPLQNVLLPTILVVGGLVFLLAAVIERMEIGKFRIQSRQPWLAGPIGTLLLLSGIALYVMPSPTPGPAPTAIAADAPQADEESVGVAATATNTPTATATATETAAPTETPTLTPTITPTPLPAPDQAVIDYMLTNVNAARVAEGLPPYEFNELLTAAAQLHSEDIAEQMLGVHERGENYYMVVSHTGSDGSSATERVAATGYEAGQVGEDIYAGRGGPEVPFSWWMDDPPHRTNILHPGYREIGIGAAPGPEGLVVYTLDFAYAEE